MTETSAVLHPDDGDLIRWIDQALSGEERSALDAHLESCPACIARRASWQRRSARLSDLLRLTDPAAPATTLRVRLAPASPAVPLRWRIAAALALLIAGAAAVPPVRAWFVETARVIWERVVPAAQVEAPAPAAPAIAFVPRGGMLTIVVPSPAARLVVEVSDGNQVRVAPREPRPAVVVLPTELRIGTPADSAAEYRVLVPGTLREVRVTLGTTEARVIRPGATGERYLLP